MLILQRKAIKKRQERERDTSLITREKCDMREREKKIHIFMLKKIPYTLEQRFFYMLSRLKRRVTPAATAAAWICI
jgi:hypothetical protein